ncbi:unnamed protein product [Aphanomyces euteiches]|uniref:Uncharacterized protein n=1 Tax=Aphanomyces euteiches TaxID=100861 RepID=A0A6G0XNW0_9STRA|nr:hypothetical protein Ae201684_002777 [Aphanomyces euteiches]KAH9157165.1 hypothetical protein AeRB84_000979 [Aphanomyces euteiches]
MDDGRGGRWLEAKRELMTVARSAERMYTNWGCFTSPIKPLPSVLQAAYAFGSSTERETLNIVDESVPDYPGPGQYPTDKILTAFKAGKDYSLHHIPEPRARPETPGPGQYTVNYGAVVASQPFDDLFRKAPLKRLSTCHVKIKQITREIHQLQYKQALALPSLPLDKQKALVKETTAAIQALLLERSMLEAQEEQSKTARRPHDANDQTPKSTPFLYTERRFFDAIDITHTKYETPMPGHCQRLDIHSTFEKSPRLPTIPKGMRPEVLPFHAGVVFVSKANPSSQTGPGEYMPDVVGKSPKPDKTVKVKSPQLTIQLAHEATNTKLPARQYLQQANADRQRKKAQQSRQQDVDLVRHLDDFAAKIPS